MKVRTFSQSPQRIQVQVFQVAGCVFSVFKPKNPILPDLPYLN